VLGEARREDVLDWIEKIAVTDYKNINFVGGEPFLKFNDLKRYIEKSGQVGLIPGVTTNGFWAESEEKAISILEKLPALKKILVSTDLYHLEFIPLENIDHLINACRKLRRFVAVNAVCANRNEEEELRKLFIDFPKQIFINYSPMMPAGAAINLSKQMERTNYFANPALASDYCGVEDHFIDCEGGVYACCMSTLAIDTNYLSLGNVKKDSFGDILIAKQANPVYKLLEEKGPRGLVEFLNKMPYGEKYRNKEYTSECELCAQIGNDPECCKEILASLNEKEVVQ